MNKLFVDEIVDRGKKLLTTPSPDRYYQDKGIGKDKPKFTMRLPLKCSGVADDDRHDYYLERQRGLPAPGSYNHVDVLGKSSSVSIIKTSP
jgi:hypothetical protein